MSINIPKLRSRTVGTICVVAAAAVAVIVSMVNSEPDPKLKKTVNGTKAKVTNVLNGGGNDASDSPDVILTPIAEEQIGKLRNMLEELEKLPKPMDVNTARDKARNGDIDGAEFLVKRFREREMELLNPPNGSKKYDHDEIEGDVLRELGISKDELTLFKNGSELPFHLDLLENKDGKLTALAKQLNDEGVGYVGGGDHESVLSNLRHRFIMKLLCSQEGYGPGGENEQLFLKLIGRSRQQLKDIALSTHATMSQSGNLDEWDMQCLAYIKHTYFSPEDFGFEIE